MKLDNFHDTVIHGFQYKPSMDNDLLIFDIDYISDFDLDDEAFFLIPSNFIFTKITDLKISLDWGDTNYSTGCLTNPMINKIEKKEINHKFHNSYYEWFFEFHDKSNFIKFGSTGYSLQHRADSVKSENTYLDPCDRE